MSKVILENIDEMEEPPYEFLYRLLAEATPEQSISHIEMPTYEDHCEFVDSRPFRNWYLITNEAGWRLGWISLSPLNEIGIRVVKMYHRHGYGKAALAELLRIHKPLPAVPGQRNGSFIANINPKNEGSIALFKDFGFVHIQNTYKLP